MLARNYGPVAHAPTARIGRGTERHTQNMHETLWNEIKCIRITENGLQEKCLFSKFQHKSVTVSQGVSKWHTLSTVDMGRVHHFETPCIVQSNSRWGNTTCRKTA